MKKLIIMFFLLSLCNIVFAEVGPFTQVLQKYFAETGQCYFKYYDYSHSKMANSFTNKAKPLKPSSIIERTKGDNFEAHKLTMLLNMTGNDNEGDWYLIDNNKKYFYSLKMGLKEGVRKDINTCEYGEIMIATLDSLPTALALTLPEEMLSSNLRGRVSQLKFDGCKDVNVGKETYQCELYTSPSNADYMKGLLPFSNSKGFSEQYKLFYNKNGALVCFEDETGRYDMIKIQNVASDDLKVIPSGYVIYTDNKNTMDGLLQKRTILEKF